MRREIARKNERRERDRETEKDKERERESKNEVWIINISLQYGKPLCRS